MRLTPVAQWALNDIKATKRLCTLIELALEKGDPRTAKEYLEEFVAASHAARVHLKNCVITPEEPQS